jgi:histidinol-phosphate aminotransferase
MRSQDSLFSLSRRSFLHLSAAASAIGAFTIATEPLLARAHRQGIPPKDAVMIDANENPLGPCQAARDAIAAIIPVAGRYSDHLTNELAAQFAQMEGLKPENVLVYPGSSEPLHHAVVAFTSPAKPYVTADPGYEAGMFAAEHAGAKVVKVPLTSAHGHDVKAMLAAAPDAGLFYICTPNNPTGTLTSHSDIEYLVANKPNGSLVLVDEAYIHFSGASSAIDLVQAGKDIVVLRTFSKIYGMAGLRCGLALGRPDLLEKIQNYGGWNALPVTGLVAASASLKDLKLVPERKRVNTTIRQATFDWLDHHGYSYIPSETNFFMLDTKRAGKDVIAAMEEQNVYVGRVWPVMPTWVRITVGTQEEMGRFQAAYQRVMTGTAVGAANFGTRKPKRSIDGLMMRA